MHVSVFLSRVRRDRKGRSDRIADCQNWQDINSENAMNEKTIETSVEVVDGRHKVHQDYSLNFISFSSQSTMLLIMIILKFL